MSRNTTAGPGTDTPPRPAEEGDSATSTPSGDGVRLGADGDWLAALADRLRGLDSIRQPVEAAGLEVEEIVEPLGQAFEGDEDAAAQAGRRLGERCADGELDATLVYDVVAELSDLAVESATDRGETENGANTGDEVEALDGGRRDGLAATNRRLLALQAGALAALEGSDDQPDSEQVETLETERDELQDRLERQRMIAKQVAAAVDTTADLNRTVSDLADRIDRRTEEQADDVETVGEEASKLSATVEEVASMADEASETSDEAVELAQDGLSSGSDALDRMAEVDRAAREVTEDVEDLQSRIAEIDAFVEVINQVADQTNLLALNASIEAARAGEAGSGFAVVADEIKDLAETSRAEAAKVETMVEEIQADAAETKESLAKTTDRLESGTEEVESAIERMEGIVRRVQETAEAIEEVSDASDDQAASAEEIAGMIDELNEKARAISEASSEISEGMAEQLENVELISSSVDRIGE